jgi:hypothetical protein
VWSMLRTRETKEFTTKFWCETLKEKSDLEDLGVDGKKTKWMGDSGQSNEVQDRGQSWLMRAQ